VVVHERDRDNAAVGVTQHLKMFNKGLSRHLLTANKTYLLLDSTLLPKYWRWASDLHVRQVQLSIV
jgi:hypothetical protein